MAKTGKDRGPKPTWTTPAQLLKDFELFLEEQKPHPIKVYQEVRRVREERKHIKRPTASDYEWRIEEIERLSKQGKITLVQFAIWKGISKDTLYNGYSDGKFKEVYRKIKTICEGYAEDKLYDAERGAAAIIFAMKNAYGWVDKTETELSGSIDTPLSPDATAALNKALNGGDNDKD